MRESVLHSKTGWTVAFALSAGIAIPACSDRSIGFYMPDQKVSGFATVVDGDTLDIGGHRIRLEGIDAPEKAQTCQKQNGATWPCGDAAARLLTKLVAGQTIDCTSEGTDKYQRMLGLCVADGRDINEAMVEQGLAWAFVKNSTRYVAIEHDAKSSKRGVWQGRAEEPWIYREHRWQSAETKAPSGCAIKGNVTAKGRIYHMPWSPWYGKVTINSAAGERWFCSESEAQAAGWRASKA